MSELKTLLEKRQRLADLAKKIGIKDPFTLQALHELILLTVNESKASQERLEQITSSLALTVELLGSNTELIEQAKALVKQKASGEVKVSNFGDMPKQERIEIPDTFKISNLKDIIIPDEISVKKPAWYKDFNYTRISKDLLDLGGAITKSLKKAIEKVLISNKEKKDAIPVKLVSADGKHFYNATGGGGRPFTLLSEGNAISYGKSPEAITPIDVTDEAQEYELPNTKKFLSVQNGGSSYIAFAGTGLTYVNSPKLVPRQWYHFVNCPEGFKVSFICDTSKESKILGFVR